MQKLISVIFFLFLVYAQISAQKTGKVRDENFINFDFGNVDKADLDMKYYPLDSSAEAVVLTEKALISITYALDNTQEPKFHYLKRVKLFKKSAFKDNGDIKIWYTRNDIKGKLTKIKAAVIQPDGTRKELTKIDFVDKKVNEYYFTRNFAFPELTEGCIIEYEYEKAFSYISTLPRWTFQENIPVRHSELWLNIPQYYEYTMLSKGQRKIRTKNFPDRRDLIQFAVNKYYADSIPAFRAEPLMCSHNDAVSQIIFQLNKINRPDGNTDNFLSDWKEVAKELNKNKYLGQQITKEENYEDVWEEIKPLIDKKSTEDQKIQIIYNYLCNHLNWNEEYSESSDETLNDAFKKKTANSGELNMMMLVCLKELDIKSYPMLISTRSNGKPFTANPMINQFSHLVCYIDRGEKSILADVGSNLRPLGMPRVESLNEQGWILDVLKPRWVPIVAPTSSKLIITNIKLDAEGTLKGAINGTYRSYSGVNERQKDAEDKDKIKKELAIIYPDIKFDSIVRSNFKNIDEPYKRNVYCEIPNATTTANNIIYLKPTLKTDYDENPFKLPTRSFPIEFEYPIRDQYILNLTLPEGYIVEEKPTSVVFNLLNTGGSFKYVSAVNGNILQLSVKIDISQLVYQPEDYASVKEFFNQVANKLAEQIVLKKL